MPETLPFRDMEGEDLAITVLTCEGDIRDPTFPFKLQKLVNKLQNLISDEENPIKVTKVEPWNSVRVTFNIPLEAAQRLRQLAERGDRVLRDLGILSVQIEGDQVITLTLASQYSEPQEIVLRKSSDEQGDVASVSFNMPNAEPAPGPSMAEPAHKNIGQFLGHLVGGTSSATSNASSLSRLEKASPKPESSVSFRSPNVIAPSSTEPIPFPPAALVTTTTAVTPSSSRVSPNVSVKAPATFGPFPFASMTHAMNTKNSSVSPQYQPVLHVQAGNPRIAFTSSTVQITNSILNSSCSSVTTTSTVTAKISNSTLQKVPRPNSAFNNVVSRTPPPNAIASTSRANVALSSPLLVNLLQSETSNLPQNNKLMPPPSQASNQQPKRKRKPRKSKEKSSEDGSASPNFSASPSPPSYQSHIGSRSPGGFDPLNVINQSLNVPLSNNVSISPPTTQITNIHPLAQGQPPVSNVKPQTPGIHHQAQGQPLVSLQSQIQGQPMVSTSRPIGHQALSAFRQTQGPRAVPNIHPQAQGQPQVHTGNLPLHTHIPVGAPQIARPTTGNLQPYSMSAPRSIPVNPVRPLFQSRDVSSLIKVSDKINKETAPLKSDRSSAPSTPSTSTPDSNPFPSPPSSSDGKTKHLINPFTGQLEPMPSDEEEEEESIGSLPPFPDFEIDTSEKSHSERSLSDGGKDTNLSSDTDSGISKSITDVSQSSTDGLTIDSGKDIKKTEVTKMDSISTASVTSSIPGEKIKLRLKLDPKTIRESKDSEIKEKRIKDSNPQYNQKIDVAVVSIPGLKKNITSASSVPEPRVPPLHISLRGPNSAVVVSPRKDDSKSRYVLSKEDCVSGDATSRISQKKVRSPRTARTGDVSAVALSLSGRSVDPIERKARGNSSKEFKKVKDDFWNQNVKNMSMSGGGIVEMSEKVSSSRISSYESYLSNTSVSKSVVQQKSSNIFSLSSRDSCKSEVMTLTSCSTGESVTIHSFSDSKSPLPLQVPAVSETEVVTSDVSQTMQKDKSSIASSIERTTKAVVDRAINSVDKTVTGISLQTETAKDDLFSSSKKSPLMQNNHLPHSPSAPVDSKNNIQTNCPSDQTQSQSASSLNVVSTVPLSSNSVISPTCNANENISNAVVNVSDSTDANKLSKSERIEANPLANVSSSTDCQKLQINNQCNIDPINNITENIDGVLNVDNVQSEPFVSHIKSMQNKDITATSEVQNATDVNKNATANSKDKHDIDSNENVKIHSSTSQVSSYNNSDKCKKLLFSNHTDSCNSLVTCLTPVSKMEINDSLESPDKGVCLPDMKKSPIAQIINVDNLSIQPHVIEVPSLQLSPAVPNLLAKSGRATEVKSVASLISTGGNAFLQTRNVLVMQDTNTITVCEGRTSPDVSIRNAIAMVTQPGKFPITNLPCNINERIKLVNHVNTTQEEPLSAKESPTQSSSAVSEESSMDSIDEERKRCMQLSEIPTSTPGPPNPDLLHLPADQNIKSDKSIEQNSNVSNAPVQENKTSPRIGDVIPPNRVASNALPVLKGKILDESILKVYSSIPQNISSVSSSVQTSDTTIHCLTSNNSSKDISVDKVNCNSVEENFISTSCAQKENQTGVSLAIITSDSPSSSLLIHDSVSSFGVENKSILNKLDVKKDPCSDSVHVVSTSSNPIVTSLLSPMKYLPQEVSSQKFKLIFKGGGQRSSLQGSNSPTSLVVPLNSSKTVPIKLVTLPGGASALSVRSTSNPNIVEIIGPKTAVSQNSQSIGNPHPSSPVRLVVSKMSPGLSCTNQSGTSNMRNRVVVKSVVMTGTSPSLKLVSTNAICTTTPVFSNSTATTTSSFLQHNFSSPSTSASCHISKIVADELKPCSNSEISMQLISSSISNQTNIEVSNLLDSKHSFESTKCVFTRSSTSTANCSSTVDSTTKDSMHNSRQGSVSTPIQKCPDPVDSSSTLTLKETPDTTSLSPVIVTPSEKIISSDSFTKVPSPISLENKSSIITTNSKNEICDDISKKSSAADTTTEITSNASSNSILPTETNSETSISSEISNSEQSDPICSKDTESCNHQNSVSIGNDRTTTNVSAESKVSIKSEQTSDSAITNSVNNISEKVEPSESASGNSCSNSPVCFVSSESQQNSKLELDSLNSHEKMDNCLDISSPCIIENEVTITSSVENEVVLSHYESNQKQELNSSNVSPAHYTDCISIQNELCKEKIVLQDDDSPTMNCGVEMQTIRPLGDESIGIVDSTEIDGTEMIAENSELEISLVYSKPLKRKCSENAAELIKACMGVEDAPKKALLKTKSDDILEKLENDKIEETVRMSLRLRKEDTSLLKKSKGTAVNSDCSTDEELTLSELVTKSRTREQPSRGRINNRDSPIEPNNHRPTRRRSGSNDSRHSEEIKSRIPRECNKKEEVATTKKLPERTKRGTFKVQDQVVNSKVGVQRSGRIRDQEAKASLLNNNKDESNFIAAKRKTRGNTDSQEMLVQVKRRRYSKDGHR